jgi:hypothetical protein
MPCCLLSPNLRSHRSRRGQGLSYASSMPPLAQLAKAGRRRYPASPGWAAVDKICLDPRQPRRTKRAFFPPCTFVSEPSAGSCGTEARRLSRIRLKVCQSAPVRARRPRPRVPLWAPAPAADSDWAEWLPRVRPSPSRGSRAPGTGADTSASAAGVAWGRGETARAGRAGNRSITGKCLIHCLILPNFCLIQL